MLFFWSTCYFAVRVKMAAAVNVPLKRRRAVVGRLRSTGTQMNCDILSLVPQDSVNHDHV